MAAAPYAAKTRLHPDLPVFLNQLHDDFHQPQYLSSDPLEFVHRFEDPWDQEAVALLAALLAYGKVKQIRKSVEEALRRMDSLGPAEFVRSLGTNEGLKRGRKKFSGFVHRFNQGDDLITLFRLLALTWKKDGSMGAAFVKRLDPAAANFGEALSGLISEWVGVATKDYGVAPRSSFFYLLTSPASGSCCKRWCMFLRWMGRDEFESGRPLDPGLWSTHGRLRATFPKDRYLRPDQLILPLDTHTGRISQYLGLTRRKSLNWKAAVEITDFLKGCNSDDPTRYDFALSRLGILDLCQRKYRQHVCEKCQLFGVCKFAKVAAKAKSRRVGVS
jgi:uncharacterized protein (TIGR02757 family)